jgi:hypothetical protein
VGVLCNPSGVAQLLLQSCTLGFATGAHTSSAGEALSVSVHTQVAECEGRSNNRQPRPLHNPVHVQLQLYGLSCLCLLHPLPGAPKAISKQTSDTTSVSCFLQRK